MSGIFEHLAADESHQRKIARQALVLSDARVEKQLGAFLRQAKTVEEFDARLSYVDEDFQAIVHVACAELGHDKPEPIVASLRDHLRPVVMTRTATFEVESRRPRMCPYHSEVTAISLAQGEPRAGYDSMAGHAFTPNHCQSNEYEGAKCKFKAEMTTQSYWDKREETLQERREQREVEQQAPESLEQPAEQPSFEAPESDSAEIIDFPAGDASESVESPSEGLTEAPEAIAEPMAVAARIGGALPGFLPGTQLPPHLMPNQPIPAPSAPAPVPPVHSPALGVGGNAEPPQGVGQGIAQGAPNGQYGDSQIPPLDSPSSQPPHPAQQQGIPGLMQQNLNMPSPPQDAPPQPGHYPTVPFDDGSNPLNPNQIVQASEDKKDHKMVTCPVCGGKNADECSRCHGKGKVADWGKSQLDNVSKTAAPQNNLNETKPEPTIDKRLWTPKNVKKIDDVDSPDGPHPSEMKDILQPIVGDNTGKLEEIGEKRTERVELDTADDLSSGFGTGGESHGPHTKTWGPSHNQANPVTAKADDVHKNPIKELLTTDFDGFGVPESAVQAAIAKLK